MMIMMVKVMLIIITRYADSYVMKDVCCMMYDEWCVLYAVSRRYR